MNGSLSPRVLQWVGLIGFVGCLVLWAVTGKQSSLFVGACLSLATLGSFGDVVIKLRDARKRDAEDGQ